MHLHDGNWYELFVPYARFLILICLIFYVGSICGVVPVGNGGTTNYWSHLYTHHRQQWLELKWADGKLNSAGQKELASLKQALEKLKTDGTSSQRHTAGGEFLSAKLPAGAKETLDRVTSEWVVDGDHPFNAASASGFRKMMSIATAGKYDGCCEKTVKHHAYAMAAEGKEECAAFHASLFEAGIKATASGDLWSKNGIALFGLISHGIERVESISSTGKVEVAWVMVEKLSGAVPCSEDRHTGDFIGEISDEAWGSCGIVKPIEQLFARISDNGANMLKGWCEGFQSPCADHTMELSVKVYTEHREIAPTIEKGRGLVGYFNKSLVGNSETDVGLHSCQVVAGLSERSLVQDVKTRWRSTHDMCESLRANQEPLLLYDVRNPNAAQGFKDNRLSLEDWSIINQTVALLEPLAAASKNLEGKNYPRLSIWLSPSSMVVWNISSLIIQFANLGMVPCYRHETCGRKLPMRGRNSTTI